MRWNGSGIDDRRWSEWRREWPERAAWTASAIGLLGLLLVSLLIAVERWGPAPAPDEAPVVVRAEASAPSRTER